MNNEKIVEAFRKLSVFLRQYLQNDLSSSSFPADMQPEFARLVDQVHLYQPWFTKENIHRALEYVVRFLDGVTPPEIQSLQASRGARRVAVILREETPLEQFMEFYAILVSGNTFIGKSREDKHKLLRFLAGSLIHFCPELKDRIFFEEGTLNRFDAILWYQSQRKDPFLPYVKKYPHYIRKQKSAAIVITGKETKEELVCFGKDIFGFFGLASGNSKKVFFPEAYKPEVFIEALEDYHETVYHHSYANHYDYYRSLYLLNQDPFYDNGSLMLKDADGHPPMSCLYYGRYDQEGITGKITGSFPYVTSISEGENIIPPGKVLDHSYLDKMEFLDVSNFIVTL